MALDTDIMALFNSVPMLIWVGLGGLILFLTIAGIVLALKWFIDKKYPKKKFIVWRPNLTHIESVRTDGEQVIEDNIVQLLMSRVKIMNERLEDFDKVWLNYKEFGFIPVSQEAYVCTSEKGHFIPMHAYWNRPDGKPFIQPEEVSTGLALARRFYEGQAFTDRVKKANEPLLMAIVHMLPLVAVLIVGIGGGVLLSWMLIAQMQQVANQMLTVSAQQAIISDNLMKMLGAVSQNATMVLPPPK